MEFAIKIVYENRKNHMKNGTIFHLFIALDFSTSLYTLYTFPQMLSSNTVDNGGNFVKEA